MQKPGCQGCYCWVRLSPQPWSWSVPRGGLLGLLWLGEGIWAVLLELLWRVEAGYPSYGFLVDYKWPSQVIGACCGWAGVGAVSGLVCSHRGSLEVGCLHEDIGFCGFGVFLPSALCCEGGDVWGDHRVKRIPRVIALHVSDAFHVSCSIAWGFKCNACTFGSLWEEGLELCLIEALERLGFPDYSLIVYLFCSMLEEVSVDCHDAKWAPVTEAEDDIVASYAVGVLYFMPEAGHDILWVYA